MFSKFYRSQHTGGVHADDLSSLYSAERYDGSLPLGFILDLPLLPDVRRGLSVAAVIIPAGGCPGINDFYC